MQQIEAAAGRAACSRAGTRSRGGSGCTVPHAAEGQIWPGEGGGGGMGASTDSGSTGCGQCMQCQELRGRGPRS